MHCSVLSRYDQSIIILGICSPAAIIAPLALCEILI